MTARARTVAGAIHPASWRAALAALLAAALLALAAGCTAAAAASAGPVAAAAVYRNPLPVVQANGRSVDSCADPTVLRGQRPRDPSWLLVCTQDPLADDDRDAQGALRFRPLPTFVSPDAVHWTYAGDAMPALPPQAAPGAALWAPELAFVDGRYRLYYTITDVVDAQSPEPGCKADSAIGVASSDSPYGPWTAEPALVVPPRRAGPGCSFAWTFDPDLLTTPDGRRLLYFGSYGGGLWVQPLDAAALHAAGSALPIARSHRYEGAEVVHRAGWYWLFASSANCCNADLTGYAVFAGRARDPLGPFIDRDGRSFLQAQVGGTPAIVQNGNRWVGAGHNSVFEDAAGRWWTAYHAVDRDRPVWAGTALTRRPLLLDPLDWVDGWPQVAGGPSDAVRPAPQMHRAPTAAANLPLPGPAQLRGALLWRDDFPAGLASPRWQGLRAPAVGTAARPGGLQRNNGLVLPTARGDLHLDTNDAPLLLAALPDAGDLWIELTVSLDLPTAAAAQASMQPAVQPPVQAGLLLYADDDRYAKLVVVALQDTQQTEFAIERPLRTATPDAPRYGNTVVGPPGAPGAEKSTPGTTRLALLLRRQAGVAVVTAFSQSDGGRWVRGGTWRHDALGTAPRLGLAAMGGAGHSARFAAVAVHRARPDPAPLAPR